MELAMFLLHDSCPSTGSPETGTLNMAIAEQNRRDIFNGLEEAIGTDQANNLMELLPKTSATELVTRADMHAFGTGFRGEMAELRGEIDTKLANAHSATQRLVFAGMIGNAIAVVTAIAV
ncbi:MAG: hypothetical protein ACI8Y4_004024 [Candidatus Poriferisodalaceae bacterium]